MMKNKSDKFEHMLKDAFLEERSLSAGLIDETRKKLYNEEIMNMRVNVRKPLKWVVSIAAGIMLTSVTVLATWQLLTPSEVASELDNEGLAIAFDSEDAIHINETVTSEGYVFTLLSIVSGSDLIDTMIFTSDEKIRDNQTYAVVAIQREDGMSMNESTSSFFISPYIRGFAPWQVNIASLGNSLGGQVETFIDGILYRIIETANIEAFANQGVYLGISQGRFSFEAFDFNEEAGTLRLNPNFNGPSVLFELPFDSSLADEVRAQEILNEIFFVNDDVEGEVDDNVEELEFIFEIDGRSPEDMNHALMTRDELADFLEARILADIANGEPEGVISGARGDREDWLRRMRKYNIEFVEVWYDDNAVNISWTNLDYVE